MLNGIHPGNDWLVVWLSGHSFQASKCVGHVSFQVVWRFFGRWKWRWEIWAAGLVVIEWSFPCSMFYVCMCGLSIELGFFSISLGLANWFLFLWFRDSCGRRTRRGKALRIIRERISDDSCSTLRLTSRLPHLPPNLFSTPAPPPEPHPFSFCHGVSKNDSYGYARARTSAKTWQPKTHLPPSSFASSQSTSTAPAQPTPRPSWSHPPTHHALICNATLVACLKGQLVQGLVTLPA